MLKFLSEWNFMPCPRKYTHTFMKQGLRLHTKLTCLITWRASCGPTTIQHPNLTQTDPVQCNCYRDHTPLWVGRKCCPKNLRNRESSPPGLRNCQKSNSFSWIHLTTKRMKKSYIYNNYEKQQLWKRWGKIDHLLPRLVSGRCKALE